MKKFVSTIAALAVVTAMAVPAMAATKDEVYAALDSSALDDYYVEQAGNYMNAVNLSPETLDVVLANVNAAKGLDVKTDAAKLKDLVVGTQTAINNDPAGKDNKIVLEFIPAADGSVTVKPYVNGKDINIAPTPVKVTKDGNVERVTPGGNGGSTGGAGSTTNPVKATGASMNMTAAISAALAMAASMGGAVVYGVKKGLLAK